MEQQQIETPEQLEQLIQVVAIACEWARMPESDSVSPMRQMDNIKNALVVVVNAARRAHQMAEPEAAPVEAPAPSAPEVSDSAAPPLIDVSANGNEA